MALYGEARRISFALCADALTASNVPTTMIAIALKVRDMSFSNVSRVRAVRWAYDAAGSDRFAQRSERCAQLGTEQFRLFPRREVTASIDLMEVAQVAIGPPRPTLRGAIDVL